MEILHLIKRPLLAGCVALTMTGLVHAAGEVSSVSISEKLATPFKYELDGVAYTWGMGSNQLLEGFTVHGYSYSYASSADRVELRRDDIAGLSTGVPCGIFAERIGASFDLLSTDYPSDGSGTGNCDMAAMLASRVINRGALDVFSNRVPNPKNVERVDYLFDTGVSAPFDASAMGRAGHVVAEKRGNNPIQIAAVLSLDLFGQPETYGPLVRVNESGCSGTQVCYGITTLRHNYLFFQSDSSAPQGYPRFLKESTESLAMAFVSAKELGLYEGQRYFGFSYFAKDVDSAKHKLVDPSSFPDDTADDYIVPGDGADIYGGVSGYFVGDDISSGSGGLYKDENGDGQFNDNEAGIASISMSLHQDSNGNGVYDKGVDAQIGDSLESDISGNFTLPGLASQSYFLVVDENDADIPPGLILPAGSNPALFQVAGADVPGLNFGFISESFNDGTSTAGGDTSGGSTAGGDTSGGSTAGGDTSGGSTAGGDTSGGSTAGGDTSGGSTAGGDTSGGSTAGGDTSGGSTAGGDTSGGSTAGGDTSGGSTAGGDTSGGSTAGGDTSGGSTAGGDTSGGSTGGGDTSGNATGGDTSGGGATTGGGVNDGVTSANPDTATVDQGSSVLIDVLANDLDGAGTGLTLVSVSESPNASISINNGQVNYTPNFGFYGSDSFLYVMQDSNGTQATGTVNVQVDRYSDINNNNVNDFIECNCTSLVLETGVHGSGLGKLPVELLLLLGAVGLVRLRSRSDRGVKS